MCYVYYVLIKCICICRLVSNGISFLDTPLAANKISLVSKLLHFSSCLDIVVPDTVYM